MEKEIGNFIKQKGLFGQRESLLKQLDDHKNEKDKYIIENKTIVSNEIFWESMLSDFLKKITINLSNQKIN